jgi:hypothetical protein
VASTRPKGLARKTGINLLPIAAYVIVALIITAGMYTADLQYRRREEARSRPPEPDIIVRNLVETSIGAGTVKDVKVDKDRKTISVTFESGTFKPDKPKKELRELLEAEATIATKRIISQLREYTRVTATIVYQSKTLAVAELTADKDTPTLTYVDDRVKE